MMMMCKNSISLRGKSKGKKITLSHSLPRARNLPLLLDTPAARSNIVMSSLTDYLDSQFDIFSVDAAFTSVVREHLGILK